MVVETTEFTRFAELGSYLSLSLSLDRVPRESLIVFGKMNTGGRLIAGSHNRNEFVLINADESARVSFTLKTETFVFFVLSVPIGCKVSSLFRVKVVPFCPFGSGFCIYSLKSIRVFHLQW